MFAELVQYPPMTNESKIIKGDKIFTTFRNKLADEVTWAINNGLKVGKGIDEFCPIGCVTGDQQPNGAMARMKCNWIEYTPKFAPTAFMDGFDGVSLSLYDGDVSCAPYHELGKLYRERFMK